MANELPFWVANDQVQASESGALLVFPDPMLRGRAVAENLGEEVANLWNIGVVQWLAMQLHVYLRPKIRRIAWPKRHQREAWMTASAS